MATSTPQRELIVQELMRRLKAAYPRMLVQRGFFAEKVDVWPSMYVLEDLETSRKDPNRKRGMYIRELMVVVSYFISGIKLKDVYEKANQKLVELVGVVEQDEYFNDPDGTRLVIDYEQVDAIIRVFKENKLEININYKFVYSDEAPWLSKPHIPQ